ncbi:hypothetical protein NLI96_g10621 [Meripilus lineatus]|uniref:DUF6534 domain-containing protein n=1 Tax=Meripilus lineatus TaxID=2056292 RepID=A0AAD5UT96_9APHY|nr:hypothetical protein NLI96_g10621 [Physisporinus lineatus]
MASLALPTEYDNTLGALYVGSLVLRAFRLPLIIDTPRKILQRLGRWVLDLLHLIFNGHAFYTYAITNYLKPLALLRIDWSIVGEMIITVISDTIVQGVFAYRIWKLSNRNVPLIVIIGLMSTFVAVTGFMLAARCVQTPFFLAADDYTTTMLYSSLAGAAVTDFTITVILCILLHQKQSVIKRTRSLIKRLMVYTINAGALTSLCAIASLIAYAVMSKNFVFLGIYSVLPKLYLNSLLATLNARWLFQKQTPSDHLSIPLSSVTPTHVNLTSQTAMSQPVDQVVEKFNPSFTNEGSKEKV